MIDNVILIITGTLHERDTHELLERCHPLGVFDTLPALCVATNVEELYHSVLAETPLGSLAFSYSIRLSPLIILCCTAPYFRDCLSAADLDDMNIEIIRNTLYKAYLEDFSQYVASLGDPTSEVMQNILSFEADRRTINITLNSFGTELSKEQRARLFPTVGRLYPAGNNMLARADDIDTVRQVCEGVSDYRNFFEAPSFGAHANGAHDTIGDDETEDPESAVAAALERRFFETEVHYNKMAFLQQFNYAVFFSYFKLREQEIRNITWIAECLAQQRRERITEFIPIW